MENTVGLVVHVCILALKLCVFSSLLLYHKAWYHPEDDVDQVINEVSIFRFRLSLARIVLMLYGYRCLKPFTIRISQWETLKFRMT